MPLEWAPAIALGVFTLALLAWQNRPGTARQARIQSLYLFCALALGTVLACMLAYQKSQIPPPCETPPPLVCPTVAPASEPTNEALDALKERYETLLVNYQFLARCGLAREEDFNLITSSLARHVASVSGPGRLTHDIVTAARGSYQELYLAAPCAAAESQATTYRAYLDQLARQQAEWLQAP